MVVSVIPTHFHDDTPIRLRQVLEEIRHNRIRVRLFMGNTDTGWVWDEENDVLGTISRSTGTQRIPILVNNSRSTGGPGILDHCILRILDTAGRELYRHQKYQQPEYVYRRDTKKRYHKVYREGMLIAGFDTKAQADRWIDFMVGRRFSK